MQVVACQLDIVWENRQANCDQVASMLRAARLQPGALVVLPEMFASGFSMSVAKIAEGEHRLTEQFLSDLARELNIFLLGGVVNWAANNKGYNEAVAFGTDGDFLARYRKIHPFSLGKEEQNYEAGSQVTAFVCGDFEVAPLICYDLRFPEVFRIAALKCSATLLAVIANWPASRQDHWITLLKARAIENQAYVVGVNRTGDDPQVHYAGGSVVIDPRGNVVAQAGEAEELLIENVDAKFVTESRQKFPALRDARPDLFSPK